MNQPQLIALLREVTKYMEKAEEDSDLGFFQMPDGSIGSSRSAQRLIDEGEMPNVYWKVLAAIDEMEG